MRPNHAYCHIHFFILLAGFFVPRPLCGVSPICGIHTEKKIEDNEKEDNEEAEKRGVMFTRGWFEIEPKEEGHQTSRSKRERVE